MQIAATVQAAFFRIFMFVVVFSVEKLIDGSLSPRPLPGEGAKQALIPNLSSDLRS
jgi:hypothetical protein